MKGLGLRLGEKVKGKVFIVDNSVGKEYLHFHSIVGKEGEGGDFRKRKKEGLLTLKHTNFSSTTKGKKEKENLSAYVREGGPSCMKRKGTLFSVAFIGKSPEENRHLARGKKKRKEECGRWKKGVLFIFSLTKGRAEKGVEMVDASIERRKKNLFSWEGRDFLRLFREKNPILSGKGREKEL